MIRSLLRVLAVAVALGNAEGGEVCDEALTEVVACQGRAVEVYEAELVEPTAELGTKWLEIEFGRNCRLLATLNTCGDELMAVCPSLFRYWTSKSMEILNNFIESGEKYWITENCPAAMTLKANEGKGPDCETADAEYARCQNASQERFDAMTDAGPDGRDNFLERKVCTWISEDYEQCQMPYVKSSCDYSQEEADQVVVKMIKKMQSIRPEWDTEKCPTLRYISSSKVVRQVRERAEQEKMPSSNSNELKPFGQALLVGALMATLPIVLV